MVNEVFMESKGLRRANTFREAAGPKCHDGRIQMLPREDIRMAEQFDWSS